MNIVTIYTSNDTINYENSLNNMTPNYLPLFDIMFPNYTISKFTCEISDRFYSCFCFHIKYAIAQISRITYPRVYSIINSSHGMGYKIEAFVCKSLRIPEDREIMDLLTQTFNQSNHYYDNMNVSNFIIDRNNKQLYVNDQLVGPLSEDVNSNVKNCQIFLAHINRSNKTRAMVDNEKNAFELFKNEMIHALIQILRAKYRLFNRVIIDRHITERVKSIKQSKSYNNNNDDNNDNTNDDDINNDNYINEFNNDIYGHAHTHNYGYNNGYKYKEIVNVYDISRYYRNYFEDNTHDIQLQHEYSDDEPLMYKNLIDHAETDLECYRYNFIFEKPLVF